MSDFLSQFESPQEKAGSDEASSVNTGIRAVEHEAVADTRLSRMRFWRWPLVVVIAIVAATLAFLAWMHLQYVEVPDFTGQPAALAQSFCISNGLSYSESDEYSLVAAQGQILSQSTLAGQPVHRGTALAFAVSNGPDPSAHLVLPDFSGMDRAAIAQWIADNKADNLRLALEYSDTVSTDQFIRIDFRSADVDAINYTRSDYATVYCSKGPDTSKNIEVPDFVGKAQDEAKSWAQANSVTANISQSASSTVQAGIIISQGTAAGTKIAEGDTLDLTASSGGGSDSAGTTADSNAGATASSSSNSSTVSGATASGSASASGADTAAIGGAAGADSPGKAATPADNTGGTGTTPGTTPGSNVGTTTIAKPVATYTVPDFSKYTSDTAASASAQMSVFVSQRYSDTVAYGLLIKQSIAPGTKETVADSPQSITVTYSLGRPFLIDCRGQTEGEFVATVFNDYTAKGAKLTYKTVYVDSDQPRGTIVSMSDYGRFIPLKYEVTIEVSKGNTG